MYNLYKLTYFLFATCLQLLGSNFVLNHKALAQSLGLSISPPVTEILIAPNKSVTTTIQLQALDSDVAYTLSLHRLIPIGESGHSTIDPKPLDQTSIPLVINLVGAEWNTPYDASLNTPTPITLKIEAANTDVPQDIYLALVARPVSSDGNSIASTNTPAISSLLLITSTPIGAIPTDIALKDPSISPIHDSSSPLTIKTVVENKSEIMLRVQGIVTLKNARNQVVQESTIEPSLVLGKTTRQLSAFDFPLSTLNFGPHTATITLKTEGGRDLVTSSFVVWILPLRYLLITIVITLVLIALKIRQKSRQLMVDKPGTKSLK